MMKTLSLLLATALLVGACTEKVITDEDQSYSLETPPSRSCAAMDVLETQLAADPRLAGRMADIEDHTRSFISRGDFRLNEQGKIEIPVVVNVLYRTNADNISDSQIQSQIDVLNEDFNALNADVSSTPALFASQVSDFDVQFVLVTTIRKYSSKRSWSLNDDMKRTSRGGLDPTNPAEYLNMWVVNQLSQGKNIYLGYAQFPGGSSATDGVVIGQKYFGRTGTVVAPYNKGRTATHEVGHWMNLRHIWGDATCGNDFVGDTPQHNTYNFGCPTYPHYSTCTGSPVEMTMNYMDYTDDACMNMFTSGQKARAMAIFASGGPRATFGD